VTFWDGMGIKAFFEVNKNIFTTWQTFVSVVCLYRTRISTYPYR
jgi:hypothetical protein